MEGLLRVAVVLFLVGIASKEEIEWHWMLRRV
jgi:hypothetical protein